VLTLYRGNGTCSVVIAVLAVVVVVAALAAAKYNSMEVWFGMSSIKLAT
jgi:hypothetical protein